MHADVKSVVKTVASMDLHAMGEAPIRGRLLLYITLYFGRLLFEGTTRQRGVYSRKYGMIVIHPLVWACFHFVLIKNCKANTYDMYLQTT